ncbi:cyclopropane mycolic acid synthase family methyltransferase [Nocardia blacklockiae]|uniref:cyclopropane mycolic acid synthase family methyltransferase n=1 Tax=Nocardia blacklockiae TaxID=480036 RepID=UPI0018934346|nr:cyclopropane mycolic acid synthase family methyltransferase [Nocardia blacklockiae]MBF6171854.1 class I SAM-dependent methyltransferase [Nocardia blacklockiae]
MTVAELAPFYRDVQAHYDVSDDFYRLFLDPSMTYSCAYFEREGMTLEQAQLAKIDLALGKVDLRPGMTLLDIGCGWGSTIQRAAQRHSARVIGLTLSRNQFGYVTAQIRRRGLANAQVRLQGWEEFRQPVDRIVSIGAFEHFRRTRYAEFFRRCHGLLPDDGKLLLHTIIGTPLAELRRRDIPVTREDARFHVFVKRYIFPGGQLPRPEEVTEPARAAGFDVTRVHSLQPHYAYTLDRWALALREHRDEAVRLTDEQTYERYAHYLTGCADRFRRGLLDVMQFTLVKH